VTKNDRDVSASIEQNVRWLRRAMDPHFFTSMQDEPEALGILQRELGTLRANEHLILADRPKAFMLATPDVSGSLYETMTLRNVRDRDISYAMFAHSSEPMPGMSRTLEIQRFEFDRKPHAEIAAGKGVVVPASVRGGVATALRDLYSDFDLTELDALLGLLWLNNESYVRMSPPHQVARTVRLLQLAKRFGGLYLDVEELEGDESGVFFAASNPPQREFLIQLMEVLNRLDIGTSHAHCLNISTGVYPVFLGLFYVHPRKGGKLKAGSAQHTQLEREFFNTQLLATTSPAYHEFVTRGLMSGDDASLVNAFIAFCHTNLAHAHPDRFDLEQVRSAFHTHPQFALQLVNLVRARFDPAAPQREEVYGRLLAEADRAVREYNTGHAYLDEIRRDVFRCCLIFIRHTLKTNFFVMGKQAFAFRLDPAYLAELGPAFTADLPQATPFRVTFFFSRFGFGYHIGFSDIARGGWRTVIARSEDDFITSANTLFRESFVLAHTQHFKNKDIYEGGSKLVLLMDMSDISALPHQQQIERLHTLQLAVTNAFLDVFVTENGVAKHPNVVDYYREDEPIELGPDENMHDNIIEAIAELSRKRGYVLGIGIMSSKRVGINHKEYAVTSTGLMKFVEIAMQELGIDIHQDSFTVKFTGGPNGDVAGNAMKILLDRCPRAQLRLILDGAAAIVDPEGASSAELRRILLTRDLDAFDPEALHVGGTMLFRTGTRKDGLRELYRKVRRTRDGLEEQWISTDEFSREFGELVFTVRADVFIPAGGRPETIDGRNWQKFLLPDGSPSARAIVEGANSFITPEARVQLQKKGVLLVRDASANKCGVISSSYEIIANLLLTENEFLENKQRYVNGVLDILERRAADEARLILARRRDSGQLCTEISDSLSREINAHYERLFRFFQARPELALEPPFRGAILRHLPAILQEEPRFRKRLERLPPKYRSAILAAEIGSSLVYRGDRQAEFEDMIWLHVTRNFPAELAA
jgi:glutamate dehydrogenase